MAFGDQSGSIVLPACPDCGFETRSMKAMHSHLVYQHGYNRFEAYDVVNEAFDQAWSEMGLKGN